MHRIQDAHLIASYIGKLQLPDGSFQGDSWGEIDTRFSYCALSSLALLNKLNEGYIDLKKALDFVRTCRNFDGGFGAVPGGGALKALS